MRAVSEKRLEISEGYGEAMNLCLGCLACQTACPAGVPFGNLLESARQQAESYQEGRRSPLLNVLRRWILTRVLYGPQGLERLKGWIRIYQRLGLQSLNLTRFLPGPLGGWERMLPPVPHKSTHQAYGELVPAVPPVRGRVGLLTGCLENVLLANIGKASVRVLARNGFEVILPPEQVCCGALPAHIGELEVARDQARKNIECFTAAKVEWVISDAAGCSAQLKEYGNLLAGDPDYVDKAQAFAAWSKDITEFLVEHMPLRGELKVPKVRVTYDDPCHLIHGQGIGQQPRELLMSIKGIEYVELPEASWCCGSAGTYNLTHVEEAQALLNRKMEHVRQVAPQVLLTANTGCYIQLAKGVREAKLDIKVMHLIELLDQAYQAKTGLRSNR